jgi:hypothetical protein
VSHLLLRLDGSAISIAQARIRKLPMVGLGIAYVLRGPLWRRRGAEANPDTFRQALRALRNEFVCKRGLTLRIFPLAFEDSHFPLNPILAEEGFSVIDKARRGRTILMDLSPPLEALREGMGRNWRRNLKQAEQNNLEVIEGTVTKLADGLISIYQEMVTRKEFIASNTIYKLKQFEAHLPDELKIKIMLCKQGDDICSGLVWSALGDMGIELFAATSNSGTKNRGSYLLRWKLVETLKRQGISVYNLNGINPVKNPGTYRFKKDLAGKHGREVSDLGKFDSYGSRLGHSLIQLGEAARTAMRYLQHWVVNSWRVRRHTER